MLELSRVCLSTGLIIDGDKVAEAGGELEGEPTWETLFGCEEASLLKNRFFLTARRGEKMSRTENLRACTGFFSLIACLAISRFLYSNRWRGANTNDFFVQTLASVVPVTHENDSDDDDDELDVSNDAAESEDEDVDDSRDILLSRPSPSADQLVRLFILSADSLRNPSPSSFRWLPPLFGLLNLKYLFFYFILFKIANITLISFTFIRSNRIFLSSVLIFKTNVTHNFRVIINWSFLILIIVKFYSFNSIYLPNQD